MNIFKNNVYTFNSIEGLTDFIAARMQDHKDIEEFYPNASMEEIKDIFDIHSAITLNPEKFNYSADVRDGELRGFVYTIDSKNVNDILETVWNYECAEDYTLYK